MVDYRMTPPRALQSATCVNARMLHREDRIGQVTSWSGQNHGQGTVQTS